MPGTKAGGKAAAITNKENHGDDFYGKIGAIGGRYGKAEGVVKGFGTMSRPQVQAAGRIGGTISRRGSIMKTKLSKQKIVTLKREYSQLKRELQEESRYQVTSLSQKYGVQKTWQ